jgi:hypothetical protein
MTATNHATRYFNAPSGAPVQEKIAYPTEPLSQADLLDDEALRCLLYVAHVTKAPLKRLLSDAIKEWYDTAGEVYIMQIERRRAVAAQSAQKPRRRRTAILPERKNVVELTPELRQAALQRRG